MIIIAVILLIVAVCCFFVTRSQSARLSSINAADMFTAQMLQDVHKQVVSSLGSDALAKHCAVAGVIETEQPLKGPLSGNKCVAYSYSVTREYEEDVTETDDKGHRTTKTEKRTDTVSTEDRKIQFYVRDETGRVLIDPDDAEIDMVSSGERFDTAAPVSGRPRTRTLGHRYKEESLAVGTQIYIVGCAVDGAGQVKIARNPHDKGQRFIISRQGGRELAESTANSVRIWKYVTAGSGAVGLLLLVIGLFT